MAKNVNIKLGANITDFESKMKRAQKGFRRTAKNLKRIGQSLTSTLTAPILGIGAAAIKGAADLEKLETSFVSLTGGTKEAADMMKQLTDFTAKTPFQIDAVANSARQLVASGTEVSQVNDQLQFLGDIAATSGSSIDDIAAIFSKVQSKGKVELESLNQLAERGIPIFKALSDATGLVPSKLGAGAVSVEQFNKVLSSFNKEGGFAEGAMLRLSETMAGKLSTALDNLKLAGADLVESMLPLIKNFLEAVTDLANKFKSLSTEQKENILQIGLLVAAIGPAVYVLGTFATAVSGLATAFLFISGTAIPAVISALETLYLLMLYNPITALALGVTALGASLYLLIDNLSDATDEQIKFNSALEDATVLTEAQAQAIDNTLIPFIDGTAKATKNTKKQVDELDASFKLLQKRIEDSNITLIEMDVDEFDEDVEDLNKLLNEATENLSNIGSEMTDVGQWTMNTFDNIANRILQFRGSFVDVFTELGIMLGKLILKAVIMAAILSALSGGPGGAILGMDKALSFGEAFTQSLTGRSGGGSVVAGQPYLVGESGPEVFMAGQSGTIIPNSNIGGGSVIPDVRISGNDLLIVFDKAQRRKERR